MLNVFPLSSSGETAIWLDLCDPTPAETAEFEGLTGVRLPSRVRLDEVEYSRRFGVRDGVLSMSAPMVALAGPGGPSMAPVGFLLSEHFLVTIRYSALHAFDAVAARFEDPATAPKAGLEVFVGLCDEIVDRLGEGLERVATELRGISTATFHVPDGGGRKVIRSNRVIRARLRQIGRLGDHLSETRDALLGVGRAVEFASDLTGDWFGGRFQPEMRTLRQDVASLDDYEVQLADKVQFLLDAMVGLIGIAQNDVFKTLTIVSIAGIPPTLIAGIYGMNFKGMPEYDWAYGYPYGLAVIAASAIIPLVWFKWRGWF